MKSFPRLISAAVLSVGLLWASAAHAATLVVSWGGDYTSSYSAFSGTPVTGGGTWTRAYSDSSALSSVGPTLYGAASLISSSNTDTPAFTPTGFGIVDGGGSSSGTDYFSFSTESNTNRVTLYGMVFLKKEDFLNGAANQTLTLDGDSRIVADIRLSSAGSSVTGQPAIIRRNRAAVYAMVDDVWGWYISNSALAGGSEHSFSNLGAMKWALYDPEGTPMGAPPTLSASYNILGSQFTDIDALGLFFHYETAGGAANAISYQIKGLRAEVAAIPEPSMAVFALGGGLLLFGARRLKLLRK